MACVVKDAKGKEVELTPLRDVLRALRRDRHATAFEFYTLHMGVALRLKRFASGVLTLTRDAPSSAPLCKLMAQSVAGRSSLFVQYLACNGGGMTLLDVLAQAAAALGYLSFYLTDASSDPVTGISTNVYFPLCAARNERFVSFYDKAGRVLQERGLIASWFMTTHEAHPHDAPAAGAAQREAMAKLQKALRDAGAETRASDGVTWGTFVCEVAMRSRSKDDATELMSTLPEPMKKIIVDIAELRPSWTFELPHAELAELAGQKRKREAGDVDVDAEEQRWLDLFAAIDADQTRVPLRLALPFSNQKDLPTLVAAINDAEEAGMNYPFLEFVFAPGVERPGGFDGIWEGGGGRVTFVDPQGKEYAYTEPDTTDGDVVDETDGELETGSFIFMPRLYVAESE